MQEALRLAVFHVVLQLVCQPCARGLDLQSERDRSENPLNSNFAGMVLENRSSPNSDLRATDSFKSFAKLLFSLQALHPIASAPNRKFDRRRSLVMSAVPTLAPKSIDVEDAFAKAASKQTFKEKIPETLPSSKITKGDYVTHEKHGVCQFEGVFVSESKRKKVRIRFRDGRLDLDPKDAKENLKLYRRGLDVGEYEKVKLNLLSFNSPFATKNWKNTKRKVGAAKGLCVFARDLVLLRAERERGNRKPCPDDDVRMQEFAATFPYEPTPDQNQTFAAIRDDMTKEMKPMDRVVIGDVGFGKTEVANRAVYRMVCCGRQVAVLAPTTILAAQHFRVMSERMPGVRIELCTTSIKRTAAQKKELVEDIASGAVQIVVGTTTILKHEFGNLGLLVIDEEQKFGVKQKDKILEDNARVDVLRLSATPIPRTMYMCAAGIHALSNLYTPPKGRKDVKTLTLARNDEIIIDAIQAEVDRGGQVFYVTPRIEGLFREFDFLQSKMPHLDVAFAYGGLKNLSQIVSDFVLKRYDVLVATSLIENGIDIPNANTVIIEGAEKFGLSTLHQIRGRVGRSDIQAYAYIMHGDLLSANSAQRMKVMSQESGLGTGHNVSQADLQIRGQGDLFGTRQKGRSALKDLGVEEYWSVLRKLCDEYQDRRDEGLDIDEDIDPEILEGLLADADDTALEGMKASLTAKRL